MGHAFGVVANKSLPNPRSLQFSQAFPVEIANGTITLENRQTNFKKLNIQLLYDSVIRLKRNESTYTMAHIRMFITALFVVTKS